MSFGVVVQHEKSRDVGTGGQDKFGLSLVKSRHPCQDVIELFDFRVLVSCPTHFCDREELFISHPEILFLDRALDLLIDVLDSEIQVFQGSLYHA